MEPIENRKKNKIFNIFLGLGILVSAFFLYPQISEQVRTLLDKEDRGELVRSIKREISNSGKLIFSEENHNSFLTVEGVFNYTNIRRQENGLSPFSSDTDLNQIARLRLDDMFANQYFEHVSPLGKSASSEAEVVWYEYISIGENIALGNFKDDETLVTAWMNSPGHRANIVSEKFTELGVAVKRGMYEGRETWIAVQIFARPLSECPSIDSNLKIQIENTNRSIEENERELSIRKTELDRMERERGQNRAEYEKAVGEYNKLVEETNILIDKVKSLVFTYNIQVRAFNTCIESVE